MIGIPLFEAILILSAIVVGGLTTWFVVRKFPRSNDSLFSTPTDNTKRD